MKHSNQLTQSKPRSTVSGREQTYRLRAECPFDVFQLATALGPDLIGLAVKRIHEQWEASIITCLTLDELKRQLQHVPEAHVMLQTVAPRGHYTGVRSEEEHLFAGHAHWYLQLQEGGAQ